jgi:uncharacterized protein YdhG (YjbR/CyaY superfamily)
MTPKRGSAMQAEKNQPTTVDEYISQFPEDVQQILTSIRAAIRESAPEAVERIGYQMPGFYLDGGLVWFAAHKRHVGLYPTPSGAEAFAEELSAYERTKGSVHFPLDKPMPYDLIRKIVRFRIAENQEKAAHRSQSRKAQQARNR